MKFALFSVGSFLGGFEAREQRRPIGRDSDAYQEFLEENRATAVLADEVGFDAAVLPIILDGENAWEHFAGGGRPFLRALYRRLSGHPELRTATMAEGCAGAFHCAGKVSRGSRR